jgi:hypothetical protein
MSSELLNKITIKDVRRKVKVYPTDFRLDTKYSVAEVAIRKREEYMVENYGSDYWLIKKLNTVSKLYHYDLPEQDTDISPQGLLERAAASYAWQKMSKGDFTPEILSRIEVAVAAYAALSECTSTKQFAGTLYLILRTEYREAITKSVFDGVLKYLALEPSDKIEAQAEDTTTPSWLDSLRTAGDNWQLALNNPCATKVQDLLTMLVTMGACGPINIKFRNLTLFAIEARKEQVHATSMIDAAFKTLQFLAESGYAAYATGSFMPFLFTHHAAARLDAEYLELLDLCEYALPGNLERFTKISPHQFAYRMEKCIKDTELMYETLRTSSEKRLVFARLQNLKAKFCAYQQTKVTGGLRERPYAIFVTGGSGLGKSDVTDILYKACAVYNDIDAGDDKVCTYNSSDKYMSNYKSYMTVVKFDDFANSTSEFVEGNPAQMLIKIINNIRESAVMADISDKGKISIEPKFVTVTSNVMDLDANIYSNCPASVLRRGDVHIVPRVKPQFRKEGSSALDSAKANAYYTVDGVVQQPDIPDLWDCDVYRAVVQERKTKVLSGSGQFNKETEQCIFEPIKFEGADLMNVPLLKVVEYCLQDSEKHFYEQREMLKRNGTGKTMPFCGECRKPTQLCKCITAQGCSDLCKRMTCMSRRAWKRRLVRDDIQLSWNGLINRQAGSVGKFVSSWLSRQADETLTLASYQTYALTHKKSATLMKMVDRFENSHYLKWTTYIPESFKNNPYVWSFMMETRVNTITDELNFDFRRRWLSYDSWYPFLWKFAIWYYFTHDCALPTTLVLMRFAYDFFIYGLQHVFVYKTARYRLNQEHTDVPALFKRIRDNNGRYIVGTIAAFASAFAMYKIWQNMSFNTDQGNLSPTSVEELDARDKEVNMWKVAQVEKPEVIGQVTNVTQLENIVMRNVCCVRVNGYCSDGFLLCSNRLVIPMHILDRAFTRAGDTTTVKVEVIRRETKLVNHKFDVIISKDFIQRIGEHDLAIIDCPGSGSIKNLVDYLPTTLPKGIAKSGLIYRNKDGEIRKFFTTLNPTVINNGLYDTENGTLRTFNGSDYRLTEDVDGKLQPVDTFDGLCAAVHCVNEKKPYIGGFHLGGRTNTDYGVSATVLKSEVDDALMRMASDGISTQAADASGEHTSYGVEHIVSNQIHAKSPLNFLEGGNLEIFGSCNGRATAVSRVGPSIISDTVRDVTGVPNTWGPPKFKGPEGNQAWVPWRASLAFSANPSCGVPPLLLKRAKQDYVRPIMKELETRYEYYLKEIRPLTNVQIVSGIDGKRFVDSMNLATSRGFPLSGPKSQDIVELEPNEEHACPRTLTPTHWDELAKFEEKARRNLRVNCPFKACLKDEPTPISKDKVRVFQAASMPLQLAMRKYFLPIARMMSQHPLMSECAVGINAHGPEMDQLFRHIRKFGIERGYAGDYSKYDLRMPAQLIYVAFDVMILVAQCLPNNYSEDDIRVMRVISTEVACAVTAYNGDFIQFIGSNPSGQSLTAYINSIVNSLLHRCSFYAWENGRMWNANFCDYVSLITYGDDYGGSVSKVLEYNNIDFVQWCAQYDMIVTPPDKKSEVTAYLDCDELDFLKRRPRYDEELHLYMGILDEKSIFKSLHSNLKSKTETKEAVSSSCIGSALSEWFLYGREHYEMRRAQMLEVANAHNLTDMVVGIDLDYEDRVAAFREKYNWK